MIELINKKKQNVVISAQYRQPAGDFKQKTYLENFFNKIKNFDNGNVIGDSNKGNLYSKGNNKGNHMAQWNLFDAVNNVILKFPADDL